MPTPARTQLPSRNRRCRRMRFSAGLAHRLRRHLQSLPTFVGTTRPSLSKRNPRPGKSHQRSPFQMDLGSPETQTALAHNRHNRRNMQRRLRLPRRLKRVPANHKALKRKHRAIPSIAPPAPMILCPQTKTNANHSDTRNYNPLPNAISRLRTKTRLQPF